MQKSGGIEVNMQTIMKATAVAAKACKAIAAKMKTAVTKNVHSMSFEGLAGKRIYKAAESTATNADEYEPDQVTLE
jgi:hypothetical protein